MFKLIFVIIFGSCFLSDAFVLSLNGLECLYGSLSLERLDGMSSCIPERVSFYKNRRKCTYLRDLGVHFCVGESPYNFICDSSSFSLSCPNSTSTTTAAPPVTTTAAPVTTTNICQPCVPCNQLNSTSPWRHYRWYEVLETKK